MDMRWELAAARQAGLRIMVVGKCSFKRERPAARLLRLLTLPKLNHDAIERIADLLSRLSEAEIVAAIRADAEYEPLGLPRRQWFQTVPDPVRHKDSERARLVEWIESRRDHLPN